MQTSPTASRTASAASRSVTAVTSPELRTTTVPRTRAAYRCASTCPPAASGRRRRRPLLPSCASIRLSMRKSSRSRRARAANTTASEVRPTRRPLASTSACAIRRNRRGPEGATNWAPLQAPNPLPHLAPRRGALKQLTSTTATSSTALRRGTCAASTCLIKPTCPPLLPPPPPAGPSRPLPTALESSSLKLSSLAPLALATTSQPTPTATRSSRPRSNLTRTLPLTPRRPRCTPSKRHGRVAALPRSPSRPRHQAALASPPQAAAAPPHLHLASTPHPPHMSARCPRSSEIGTTITAAPPKTPGKQTTAHARPPSLSVRLGTRRHRPRPSRATAGQWEALYRDTRGLFPRPPITSARVIGAPWTSITITLTSAAMATVPPTPTPTNGAANQPAAGIRPSRLALPTASATTLVVSSQDTKGSFLRHLITSASPIGG
mmetsp:Transcript_16939/g.34231  ORF Transcript_16939/g.34231 Transcript_16939/m.34231 type:complete len:436 (+) Transcript_16939:339-1646(+)